MHFDSIDAYKGKIKKILITEEEIQSAVKKTAEIIDSLYDGTPILLVSILKGAFIYMADVCKNVTVPCEVAFMTAQSYFNDTVSSGKVEITMDIKQNLADYHVVILEDIVDTGRTLSEVVKILKGRNPKSFRVITLLDKPARRVVDFKADVSLFTIPDYFVIGYGLDCGEHFRNLPYVAEYNTEA
ncbi:MAG: hypoxanthine phosphoribosyltransferase [Ruminococcaceae bacterium]|nr:hypoxanthine phosphoribosyltransferase [Oscillospiraceae bacterium]